MGNQKIGTLKIQSAKAFSKIGLYESEKINGNEFEFDITLQTDFNLAAEHDDIRHTADYAKIYNEVLNIIQNSEVNLLEKVVVNIAELILKNYVQVLSINVSLRKLNPPVSGFVQSVEASYYLKKIN